MRTLIRPRIFISYAREDVALAKSIRDMLVTRGFNVFFDASVRGGEDFVRRLTEELRSADAVVALLTPASATSEWCQTEWYFAHGRGVTVIPIRAGDVEAALPTPLRLLENRIHFLTATDRIGAELAKQLDDVRRARRRHVALRIVAGVLLLVIAVLLVSRAEWVLRARERTAVVRRLVEAVQPLPAAEIARIASRFAGDESLLGTALRLRTSSEVSDPARLNAVMLSSALLRDQQSERRHVVRNTTWRNGVVDGGNLLDVTFASGVIERLAVRRSTLASVFWGRGLTLSNVTFQNVKFDGGGFTGTNLVRADFLACMFYGVELDVTNFSLAKFRSAPDNPEEPNVITGGTLCAFENSVIVNRSAPPAPNVTTISFPQTEVQFQNVGFTGVRFRGYIKPEWFRDCFFDRCTFPKSLSIAALETRGNRVSDSTQHDEPLD